MLLVDNNPLSYKYDKENGVPIISWFGNSCDRELYKLAQILKKIRNKSNLPKALSKYGKKPLDRIVY